MNYLNKKIAVLGVSNKEKKYGFRIFRDLVNKGYNVKGVNPADGEVLGNKIYRTLNELEEIPDLVITVVPHEVTEKAVEICKELGIKEIWMQPGSESEAAIQKAGEYGIHAVHNACFMVENGIW